MAVVRSTSQTLSSPRKEVRYHSMHSGVITLYITHTLVPARPKDVAVVRVNGTAMRVSFTPLTIVEARRISVAYFISYSPRSCRKRQEGGEVRVPDGKNETVITGLDPKTEYDVVMYATDSDGNNRGSSIDPVICILPPPGKFIYVYIVSAKQCTPIYI